MRQSGNWNDRRGAAHRLRLWLAMEVADMNEIHRIGLGAAAVLVLAIAGGGCGNSGPAPSTLEVRRGASEAAKLEAEARMDATYEREQARKHASGPGANGTPGDAASVRSSALASAEAAHAAALLRCNVQPGDSLAACRERADSELATARARAEAAT